MPETPTHDPVRAMLDERSRDLDLDTSLPASVARRSRRRRWMTGGAAAAGAAAAVVAAILVVGAVTGPSEDLIGPPTPTNTQDHAVPATYVAVVYDSVMADGSLVRFDTATGEMLEELLPGRRVTGPIALAPGGIYIQDGWLPKILFLPDGATETEFVVNGMAPAVSPDGGRLAYARLWDGPPGECTEFCTDVVIRDLATGKEVVWHHGDGITQVSSIGWLSGDRLAMSVAPFGEGDPTVVKVVGANEGGRLDHVDPIMQPEPDGPNWHVVGYHEPTGGLLVNETCCFYGEDAPSYAIRSVDPDTGEVLATFAESRTWVVGSVDAGGTTILLKFQSPTDGTISEMTVIAADGSRMQIAPTQASWLAW